MKKQMTSGILVLFVAISTSIYAIDVPKDKELQYRSYTPQTGDFTISRAEYADKLYGFWLGQCIANWTGLRTEMARNKPPFYTDKDWDTKNGVIPKKTGEPLMIEFVLKKKDSVWGSDDDTDIEYMYQHVLDKKNKSILSPEDIRDAWIEHIIVRLEKDKNGKESKKAQFLWVSNKNAYWLMVGGMLPPDTSDPKNNNNYDMIDAQLTTEIFGLFAPARPDVALKMAHLPIRTVAYQNAEWISEFYVIMHSLASSVDTSLSMKEQTQWLAEQARKRLPENSYSAKMYDFVKAEYDTNSDKNDWEKTRDALYERYQARSTDGYKYRTFYDAGINYGASLISLFYGQGDFKRTIQIGTLVGWDSDNPTATWGGLLGFMIGREGVEKAFPETELSGTYKITRTRQNFPDYTPNMEGEDTFEMMAQRGVQIIDRVVIEEMGGGVDLDKGVWSIPDTGRQIQPAHSK